MNTDHEPGNLLAAQDIIKQLRVERDTANSSAINALNQRDAARRMDEIIFDLSFEFGFRWANAGDKFTETADDLWQGALGRRDWIMRLAETFDKVWEAKAEDAREDYWGDIDTFFSGAFSDLEKRVEAVIVQNRNKVVSVQVTPITETYRDGQTVVEAQPRVDEATTGWGVYRRFADGTVSSVCDCGNEDDAMLMGGLLAASSEVSIEPRPALVEHCYRVKWEMDVHAPDPLLAARRALETQRNTESTALCFDVQREDQPSVHIDLEENT